jgi:hypothetical protein
MGWGARQSFAGRHETAGYHPVRRVRVAPPTPVVVGGHKSRRAVGEGVGLYLAGVAGVLSRLAAFRNFLDRRSVNLKKPKNY